MGNVPHNRGCGELVRDIGIGAVVLLIVVPVMFCLKL